MINKSIIVVMVLLSILLCVICISNPTIEIQLLSTTDLHCHVMDYDYYRDQPTEEFGLVRTAELIASARKSNPNSLLFDNGDLIQGSPMGDFIANVQKLPEGSIHPIIKVMNKIGYDAAGLGNHEFNYGLDFLKRTYQDAKFPLVCGNVYPPCPDSTATVDPSKKEEEIKPYFTPFCILEKKFFDKKGTEYTIRVGVLSLLPPQIMTWDAANLQGKVSTKGIVESAQKWIPKMKKEGADIIVVLAHGGIDTASEPKHDENAIVPLSQIPGIDAIFGGHTHDPFPNEGKYFPIDSLSIREGTINKIPVAIAGPYGAYLAGINLTIEKNLLGTWNVVKSKGWIRPVVTKQDGKTIALTKPMDELVQVVRTEHESTLQLIQQTFGKTEIPLHTYLAQVYDNSCVELINLSQRWYLQEKLKNTEYKNLPILSAAAPFKCGGRGGPNNYIDIDAGLLAMKDIASIYVYPNTLVALKLNGRELREYLEMSAGQFKQIIATSTPQLLLDETFPSFNFDIVDGVTFEIDVTKPARYSVEGYQKNWQNDDYRIVNLCYNGQPVTKEQEFILATNNYRAYGGGNFPHLANGQKIIYVAPDEVRQIIIRYVQEKQNIAPTPDKNWKLSPWPETLKVYTHSSPKLEKYRNTFPNIQLETTLDSGFAQYWITPEK